MSQCLVLPGGQVYSKFRRNILAKKLDVAEVKACYVHLVALHGAREDHQVSELNSHDLQRLLSYGEPYLEAPFGLDPTVDKYLITPRTLSPWSSKATNIAQVCGFGRSIKRIERGIIVTIVSKNGFNEALAADLLHDRMTQSFTKLKQDLTSDVDKIFAEPVPAPAEPVELYQEGISPHDALQKANVEMGLALGKSEIEYLVKAYAKEGSIARNPYDVELFMFAQVRWFDRTVHGDL